MPALDSCHFQVVHALEKDGWQVDPKPLYVFDRHSVVAIHIDIGASKADVNGPKQQIYVEVKCFPGHNYTQELYIVLGQYIIYRVLLATQKRVVSLYLAIPQTFYDKKFNAVIQQAIKDNGIKLIVVDLDVEEIRQWIE